MNYDLSSLHCPVDIMTLFVKHFTLNLLVVSKTCSYPVLFLFGILAYTVKWSCMLLNTRSLELDRT